VANEASATGQQNRKTQSTKGDFIMNKMFISSLLFLCLVCLQVNSQYTAPVINDSSALTVTLGDQNSKYSVFANPGRPALPTYQLTFLRPPDADIYSVKFSLLDTVTKVLDGDYSISPAPPERTCATACVSCVQLEPAENVKDTSIYNKNEYFPAGYLSSFSGGMSEQYKFAKITIYPYRYNPVSKKLLALVSGKVKVDFATTPNFSPYFRSRIPWCEQGLRIDNDTSVFQLYAQATATKSFSRAQEMMLKDNAMIVSGSQFAMPVRYAGITCKVSVYNLFGKKMLEVHTMERVINVKKDMGIATGRYIVKISPLMTPQF
jgi:hypothetical protein